MQQPIAQTNTVTVPSQVIEVKQPPNDFTTLAWSMLDKVAEGSTAVIFAIIIVWWFSRKAVGEFIHKFNTLMETLSQATRDNSHSQKELTKTQEHLNTTLQQMGDEDVRTAALLGKMNSKLALIRSILIEVRSYQTGIPQNRASQLLDVLDVEEEDSELS